jgi:soluble lytic murein transglycosylase
VVRPDEIWAHAQTYNVDPWVMLGLMRQESTYRNTALSPVGAIGLVQVMPRTGARVAAMLGEQRYSPGDLEDPAVNLRYGIFYFSKLLDRFDGVFPLAVASYNGGPHNVSRWYRPLVGKIELDALVEQMQYDETRDYVKKVTGNYARYVALYEPTGARVVVPLKPAGDHAEIINF